MKTFLEEGRGGYDTSAEDRPGSFLWKVFGMLCITTDGSFLLRLLRWLFGGLFEKTGDVLIFEKQIRIISSSNNSIIS